MASKYWIKLYHEILDDPKMGRMSDGLFRRTIQLFLMAGELDSDGILPAVDDIAWRLRIEESQLNQELQELEQLGIVTHNGDWVVTKFADRQSAMSNAERTKRYREEKQREEHYETDYVTNDVTNCNENCNESVTNRYADKDIDTDTDKNRLDTEQNAAGAVFRAYESEIGLITPTIADKIGLAIEDYPLDWITDGIKQAAQHNARSWAYVEAILKRWKVEGKSNGKRPAKVTSDDNERIAQEVMNEYLATQRR